MYEIKSLVGANLQGWQVKTWYELSVFTSETSTKVEGYYTDHNLANVRRKGAGWEGYDGHVKEVYVLTRDNKTGYLLGESATLQDEDNLRQEALDKANAKLTPEEMALIKAS